MKRTSIILTILSALAVSCTEEKQDSPIVPAAESSAWIIMAEPSAIGPVEAVPWTRTYVGKGFEEKIHGATLGIYQDGKLVTTRHIEGAVGEGFDIAGELLSDEAYSYYLLTGTIASSIPGNTPITAFPDNEDDVAGLEFFNSAGMASTLKECGLDRAGCILDKTPEEADEMDGKSDGRITIPLRSLWAKVVISMDFSEIPAEDFDFRGTAAMTCNRRLRPFATEGSKALAPADTETGLSDDAATLTPAQKAGTEPLVLYLPENMQGTLLPTNSDPYKKTLENSELPGAGKGLLTYIKVLCSLDFKNGVSSKGNETAEYRILPGENNVSNFDIRGGKQYKMTLRPTVDGIFMDIWKFGGDMEDSRDISIAGIQTAADQNSPRKTLTTSETIAVSPSAGTSFMAIVNLSPEGSTTGSPVDYTIDSFEDKLGWDLTEESKERLRADGIEWSIDKVQAWHKEDGSLVFRKEGEPTEGLISDGSGWLAVLSFSTTKALEEGEEIPVTIATPVKGKEATFSVKPTYDGLLTISPERDGGYIAQLCTVTPRWTDPGIEGARFVTRGTYGIVELQNTGWGSASGELASGETARVGMVKSGTGTIQTQIKVGGQWKNYNILVSEGSTLKAVPSTLSYTVSEPTLLFKEDLLTFCIDGTPQKYTLQYHGKDNSGILSVAAKDDDGFGDKFTPSLYSRLLEPVIKISTYGVGAFLGEVGKDSLAIIKLKNGDAGIVPDYRYEDLIEGYAKAYPAIKDNLSAIAKKPAYHNGEETNLGILNNTAIVEISSRECVRKTRTQFSVSDESLHFGDKLLNTNLSDFENYQSLEVGCPLAKDLRFKVEQDGSVSVHFIGNTGQDAEHSAGKFMLQTTIKNKYSGEDITVELGTLEVYLHATHIASIYTSTNSQREHIHEICARIQTSFNARGSFLPFVGLYDVIKDNDLYQMAYTNNGLIPAETGNRYYYKGTKTYLRPYVQEKHVKAGEFISDLHFGEKGQTDHGLSTSMFASEILSSDSLHIYFPPIVALQSGLQSDDGIIDKIDKHKGDYAERLSYKKIGNRLFIWSKGYKYPVADGEDRTEGTLGIGYAVLQLPTLETDPVTCHWVSDTEFKHYD